MTCSRCNAEAVVKRGAAAYCAKCALARDWEEIIMIVQEDRVETQPPEVEFTEPAAAVEEEPKAKKPKAKKPKAKTAAAKADPDTNGELPADPFA